MKKLHLIWTAIEITRLLTFLFALSLMLAVVGCEPCCNTQAQMQPTTAVSVNISRPYPYRYPYRYPYYPYYRPYYPTPSPVPYYPNPYYPYYY